MPVLTFQAIGCLKLPNKSRDGITTRNLPSRLDYTIASSFLRVRPSERYRVNENFLQAIIEAGDQFFGQPSEDKNA